MLIAVVALAIAVLVPAARGKLSNLGRLRLRGVWIVCAALGVQTIALVVAKVPQGAARAVHIATYVAILAFIVANRRIPWIWVLAIGTALNFVVISANGGVMPASHHELQVAGLSNEAGFHNSSFNAHPHLGVLGDIFATPPSLPLANVFSVGDVILLVGLAMVIVAISRTPPATESTYMRPRHEEIRTSTHDR